MEKSLYCQWEMRGENTYFPCLPTVKGLPAGVYEIKHSKHFGIYLMQTNVATENIVSIPVPECQNILDDIKMFWEKRDVYKLNNMVYKRGVLLFGPAGTGKSYIIQQLIKYVIEEKNGIAISLVTAACVDHYADIAPQVLRGIEEDRPIIIVMEELTELINKGYQDTSVKLLSILDGLKQAGGTVFVASTNSVDLLQNHFKNRPGRFDLKQRIGLPSADVRHHFLKSKLNAEQQEKYNLQKMVTDTEGFSLAHIKELFISVVIMNHDYDKTISNLKMMSQKDTTDEAFHKIGF